MEMWGLAIQKLLRNSRWQQQNMKPSTGLHRSQTHEAGNVCI